MADSEDRGSNSSGDQNEVRARLRLRKATQVQAAEAKKRAIKIHGPYSKKSETDMPQSEKPLTTRVEELEERLDRLEYVLYHVGQELQDLDV